MKLVDLRKLAIRKQHKIRFRLTNGMECVIDEDGVARVPASNAVPDFNLEQELAAAADVRGGARDSGRTEERRQDQAACRWRATNWPPWSSGSPGARPQSTTNTTTNKCYPDSAIPAIPPAHVPRVNSCTILRPFVTLFYFPARVFGGWHGKTGAKYSR